MGDFVNSCSGAGVGSLPSNNLDSLLYNVPGATRDERAVAETKELLEVANPRILIQDSGGFQLFLAKTKGEPYLYAENLPIYHHNVLNLTPQALIHAALIFKPDIIISPDDPIPKCKNPLQQHALFLEHYAFNLKCAQKTAELMDRHRDAIGADLFLAIQSYTLDELEMFLNDLGDIRYGGLSIPKRTHDPIDMAVFLLKFHSVGTRKAHVLGSLTFSRIAICAFFARHFFDFLSMDATTWRRDAELEKYYLPHDLRALRLQSNAELDQSVYTVRCNCPWCRGKTLADIKDMLYTEEKTGFLRRHNYWVIEECMRDCYEHAETPETLRDHLLQHSGRIDDISAIYRCLSDIRIIKDSPSARSIKLLHEHLCAKQHDMDW